MKDEPSRKPFRRSDGRPVHEVGTYVREWLKQHPHSEVHVGCDSKTRSEFIKFSTVICMREIGKGVHEIHRNDYEKGRGDKMDRLWREVSKALAIAEELKEIASITIHVDLNSDQRAKSNRLYDASIGMIRGMGFHALGKPDAWAASSGANKHCE
jgi:predicted RNase H-related nuclease YkuK (DUF458 family)